MAAKNFPSQPNFSAHFTLATAVLLCREGLVQENWDKLALHLNSLEQAIFNAMSRLTAFDGDGQSG